MEAVAGGCGGAAGDGFDRRARTDLLQVVDDDLVARLQARGDQPLIADRARSLEHAQFHLAVRAHDQRRRLALRVAAHRELRHEDRVRRAAFLQPRAHKHAGQQLAARVRENRAHRDGIRHRIHRHVGHLQRALLRIDLAVFVDELHAGLPRLVRLEPAAREVALQPQEFAAGLGHIHVDAVELLHRREQCRRLACT